MVVPTWYSLAAKSLPTTIDAAIHEAKLLAGLTTVSFEIDMTKVPVGSAFVIARVTPLAESNAARVADLAYRNFGLSIQRRMQQD